MSGKTLKAIVFPCCLVLMFTLFLSGCDLFKSSSSSESPKYKEIKQMVNDILQTEDSKKIIQESLQDPKAKKKLIMNSEEVTSVIEKELLSPENMKNLAKLYEDPKFTKKLVEGLSKETDKVMKGLMKDPDFREDLIKTMNDEEFKKIISEVINSNEYRKQMMVVIKDSFESPVFKNELLELIEKAAKSVLEPKSKESGGK